MFHYTASLYKTYNTTLIYCILSLEYVAIIVEGIFNCLFTKSITVCSFPVCTRMGERDLFSGMRQRNGRSLGSSSVTFQCVSVDIQFESLNIKQSSIIELYVKWSSGTCPDRELFCPVSVELWLSD